jgi:hypothetical protein
MLRDGFYRLCEAYMNGGISEKAYRNVILNADTFMVVASALQTLGSNQIVPPQVITAGSISDTTGDSTKAQASIQGTGVFVTDPNTGQPMVDATTKQPIVVPMAVQTLTNSGLTISADNAAVAAAIIHDYLRFRAKLNRETAVADKADEVKMKARGLK